MRHRDVPPSSLDQASSWPVLDRLAAPCHILLRGGRTSDLERAAARLHTASRPGRRLVRLDGNTTGRERPALQRITIDVAWDDASDGSLVIADLFRLALPVQIRLVDLLQIRESDTPRLVGLAVNDARRARTPVARALLDSLLLVDLPPIPRNEPTLTAALTALGSGDPIDLEDLSQRAARIVEAAAIARTVRQLGGDRELAAERLGIEPEALDGRLRQLDDAARTAADGKSRSVASEALYPRHTARRRRT